MGNELEIVPAGPPAPPTYEQLLLRLEHYEAPGPACLYYALQRKTNEMAAFLNSWSFAEGELNMTDKDDKKFERLRAIWQDCKKLAGDLEWMKGELKLTDNEEVDTKPKASWIESQGKSTKR